MGADFLVFSLLDTIVDNYFLVLEKIGEKIDSLQEDLIKNPNLETLEELQNLKNKIIFIKKSIWPLREVINQIYRGESELIEENSKVYYRDLYDHIIQIIDIVETYRDTLSSMFDIYISSVSNKMNSVMKMLTIIATIFIPLTFIAGIYGMNFKYIPELE